MEVVNELITAISAQIPHPHPGKPSIQKMIPEVSQRKHTAEGFEEKHLNIQYTFDSQELDSNSKKNVQ